MAVGSELCGFVSCKVSRKDVRTAKKARRSTYRSDNCFLVDGHVFTGYYFRFLTNRFRVKGSIYKAEIAYRRNEQRLSAGNLSGIGYFEDVLVPQYSLLIGSGL